MITDNAVQELVESLKPTPQDTNSTYSAVVSRVDDENVVWVNLVGSEKETPTASTSSEVKSGDVVTVEWRNNRLYIVGNNSNPSAGVVRVANVEAAANTAREAANNAVADAGRAREAADSAVETAKGVEGIAKDAQTNAGIAKTAADSAMLNLSNVEDVVGVLDWITNHGTMESQQGKTFDENGVYFVVDPNGDYVIGGTHYSLVTNPVAADIDSYYCLSVDRSIQNYVATHIVVDSEGLWIIPDSGGNKVLIATGGAGKTYETAGTYIVSKVGNNDVTLASFTTDGVQIGRDGETHTNIDYHSLQLTDKEGNVYFHVSDLRDKDDGYQAIVTETYIGNGVDRQFSINASVSEEVSAVDGSDSSNKATLEGIVYTFTRPPARGAEVTIIYKTTEIIAKAFTLGKRAYRSNIGLMSIAEGNDVTASGQYSHVEGSNTKAEGLCAHAEGSYARARGYYSHAEGHNAKAIGQCSHAEGAGSIAMGTYSHAEGFGTEADGFCSHVQNFETIAGQSYQTAIGKYNDNKEENALEIGNGTSDSDRSNAFAVTWDGDVINTSKDYERDVGGSMNTGYNLTDKNGDIVAYMKGLATFDSQNRPIEGFNIGTSRVVGSSTKWNTLRMQIDADGNPVVAINQPEAWRTALGLEPFTPSISITSTTGTLNRYVIRQMEKLVSLTLYVYNKNSVASGSNIYQGTINTVGLRPIANTTTATFNGARLFGGMINPAGTITLRNTTASAVTISSSNIVVISFVYFVE